MNKQANSLQESLERLEAGESLESSQQNLPVEEQPSLSLVSRLRAVDWPRRDPKIVTEQRAQIVTLYKQDAKLASEDQPRFGFFKDWRLPVAISAAVALLMVCGLVTVSAISILWFTGQRVSLSPLPKGDITKQVVSEQGTELTTEPSELTIQPTESTAESQSSMVSSNQATLSSFYGLVEIQTDETWQVASDDSILTNGARLRTASFSSVLLTFPDGSLAQIGPDSEISIEKLTVDPTNGTRDISLMQWSGESTHTVVSFDGATPNYRVDTPSASGQVKGTQFHVQVVADQTVWMVDDGAVEVSGGGTSVQVEAGEKTSVSADEPPADPVEFITGQGEVNSIGKIWVINDQPYQIHTQTIIIGNPQVGDLVFYQGHLEDGSRVADQIVLIHRNPANTFTLTGEVESRSDTEWLVNGQKILITDQTVVDDDIVKGDLVRIKGIVLGDGELQAEEILLISDDTKIPFEFSGVVQDIGQQEWLISGITVTVNADTVFDNGLAEGDAVQVKGLIMDDGTWWASSITPFLDESSAFEFVGYIDQIDPWIIAGVNIDTQDWTAIDEGLQAGDLVQVSGQIQPDGTWLAFEIRRYDQALLTILVGRVFSIDPWVVSGVKLNVDTETIIEGQIELNMLVRVELQMLPDGSHKVIRITPFDGFDWDMACQSVVVTVTSIDGDQIILDGWPVLTLSEDTQIKGELMPGSVVQTMICYDEDGNVVLVYITVLENPELPQPPDEGYDDGDGGNKVTICHKPGKINNTISIASSAVPAHLAHGDALGACTP
jgi:hypothetical protein